MEKVAEQKKESEIARKAVEMRAGKVQMCRSFTFGRCAKEDRHCLYQHGTVEEARRIKCVSARKPGDAGYHRSAVCAFGAGTCPYGDHVSGLQDI